jgi:Kef-type K+ transport system membrane component KefB
VSQCLSLVFLFSNLALPVLCRILASRKLISTTVGQSTLAAAATDDAIAWCLLVLVVALVNNPKNAINALYVFLIVAAFALFLWFTARPLLKYLVSRNPNDSGVSQLNVTVLFVILLSSAWFTQAVGVHAIFGGFLVGLITPHEHGFAIAITEKCEDLVSILLLPLYFAYSGLGTQLGALADFQSIGIVLLVWLVACGGKIIGCGLAAHWSGLNRRESLTVGFLMNTKGLVELIVLNLGLRGGVINEKIFAIFVVMALMVNFYSYIRLLS